MFSLRHDGWRELAISATPSTCSSQIPHGKSILLFIYLFFPLPCHLHVELESWQSLLEPRFMAPADLGLMQQEHDAKKDAKEWFTQPSHACRVSE